MSETSETVTVKGNTIRVKSGAGYATNGLTLVKMTDTGNGFIAKFPSHSSYTQDAYVCMDYVQAESLFIALREVFDDCPDYDDELKAISEIFG